MLVAVAVAGLVAGVAGLSIAVVAHNLVNQFVGECGEMLRRQLQVASGSVDERALRDLAIVHYDALKEMSGHRSFSLALINLFPFLPLDGGHIFWSVVEKVRGRRVAFSVMEKSGAIGFVLILCLAFIGLTNDLDRIISGEGFGIR